MIIEKPATAIILLIAITLSACVTQPAAIQPHVTSTTATTELDYKMSKRIPLSVFSLEDSVVCLVDFQWADVTKPSGSHLVEWRWYKDGALVSENKKEVDFDRSPHTTRTTRSATSLGIGHFTVTTGLDGTVASTCEFDIRK